ncbi:MFS general substrate transporter [Linderina pennispora]|uniref:MFS general substrate transporter n=1 Tax=Linderina pennispora TaxID=61395 RepID=A0A1Y1W978_9FUNG|nr:MFS general substrate transporter [Linderina pennispora]ORX70087.1 MFS general substrate transporter [Linderina pennispora]
MLPESNSYATSDPRGLTQPPTAVASVHSQDRSSNYSHSSSKTPHSSDVEKGFVDECLSVDKQSINDSPGVEHSRSTPDEKSDAPAGDPVIEYAPADTGYAWVIVVCAGFCLMCTVGVVNAFGVFSTHYLNFIFPTESASNIAWIGTMLSLFMLGGSVTTGPLTDRFGFRTVALAGAVICFLALLLASFANALWQLVLTQGILFGIGAACIFSPSVSLVAQWHTKSRPLATGLAVAGSGAGGMIFTEVTQRLMTAIGHKWTLRVLALIIFVIAGSASMFYKRRVSVPRGGTDFRSMVNDPRLIIVGLSGFFVNVSYFIPWYYLPTAALKIGETKQAANNLVLFMNAGSTVGRVVAAFVAIAMGPINSISAAYIICAVLVLIVMLAVKSMVGYIVLSVIYGGLSASFISIMPLILTTFFGAQGVTTAMGIMNMYCSIGVLIGNPSQGAIYQKFDRPHDSFTAIAIWGFVGLALAGISYIMLKVLVIRGTEKRIWSKM